MNALINFNIIYSSLIHCNSNHCRVKTVLHRLNWILRIYATKRSFNKKKVLRHVKRLCESCDCASLPLTTTTYSMKIGGYGPGKTKTKKQQSIGNTEFRLIYFLYMFYSLFPSYLQDFFLLLKDLSLINKKTPKRRARVSYISFCCSFFCRVKPYFH